MTSGEIRSSLYQNWPCRVQGDHDDVVPTGRMHSITMTIAIFKKERFLQNGTGRAMKSMTWANKKAFLPLLISMVMTVMLNRDAQRGFLMGYGLGKEVPPCVQQPTTDTQLYPCWQGICHVERAED